MSTSDCFSKATVVNVVVHENTVLHGTAPESALAGLCVSDLREASDLLTLFGETEGALAQQTSAKVNDETFLAAPQIGSALYLAQKTFSVTSPEAQAWQTAVGSAPQGNIVCFFDTPEASFPVAPAIDYGHGALVFHPEKNRLLYGQNALILGSLAYEAEGTLRQEGIVTVQKFNGDKESCIVDSLERAVAYVKEFNLVGAVLARRNVLTIHGQDLYGPSIEEASLLLENSAQKNPPLEMRLRSGKDWSQTFWSRATNKYPNARLVRPTNTVLLARRKIALGFRPRAPFGK